MAVSTALDWLNGVDTSIFAIDGGGDVTMWNRATEFLLGFTSDEMMNQSLSSLIFNDDGTFDKIVECRDGSSEHFLMMKTKDGPPVDIRIKTSVQRNQAGEFTSQVCFAEKAFRKVSNGYQTPLQRSTLSLRDASVMIFSIDASGIIDIWNEKSALITGFSKEEAIGSSFLDLMGHPLTHDSLRKTLLSVMKSDGELTFEVELRSKCELPLQFSMRSSERLDCDGNRIGTLFAAQCETESALDEGSIETVLYAKLFEHWQLIEEAYLPIFGVDADGDVNLWNLKMVETTGHSLESAFDKNFVRTFVTQSFRQPFQEIVDKGLKGHGTSGFEFEFMTVAGDVRYFLLSASTRRDILGNIVGVFFVSSDATDQIQHSLAITAMARELRQVVDTAKAPIFGIDVDGMVNEWNNETAEITGFSGDEAFNRPLVDTFIVPTLRGPVQEVLDNALRGEGTSIYELELLTKGDEPRHLIVSFTTRRDAENSIVGVVGVGQDVTEGSKHDRAVAAMASELRQLIDTSFAPIFGIDADGDVNEWNDKAAEVTGYTKEEAFDRNLVKTFIVPRHRESMQDVVDKALKGRGTSNYELEFTTKSNETRHLLVNATTRRDAENNVVGVVGVAQDVTDAVQRDRAVAGMANELRQLIDTANAPIFGIDVDGNVNEWNSKTAEVTGFTKDEAFDEPFVDTFIAPARRQQVSDIMNKALAGHATSNYELEINSKSKEKRILLVNATTRRDPDYNIVGGK